MTPVRSCQASVAWLAWVFGRSVPRKKGKRLFQSFDLRRASPVELTCLGLGRLRPEFDRVAGMATRLRFLVKIVKKSRIRKVLSGDTSYCIAGERFGAQIDEIELAPGTVHEGGGLPHMHLHEKNSGTTRLL